ncbi:putative Calumenin [Hypsibius exemplaris]|uniref:Reticulocalbin-3 n=1 Tax=Hypsibius exemplaris TaxID=2072580 RepID=A0A1W0WYW9_HYPEX|nr:putative Calumenin [Hypsibius exemplaris]
MVSLLSAKDLLAQEREQDGAYSPKEKLHKNDAELHHEAILGNEKLHQEFHQQSPEQSRERLLKLATTHDLDHDGQISLEELQEWIFQSFQDLSSEDAQNKFQDVDSDGDGFITWNEHLRDTWGLENDENLLQSEEYKDEYVMIKEEALLFNAADRDQDGKLSAEEFLAFDRPEQYAYMQPLVIQRTKEARDKNGDGFIDFHEYIIDIVPNYKKMTNQEEREVFVTEKERFEQFFDQDHDGKLNDTEIFRWLIPDDRATAAVEAEHIFEKSDANKDSQLSFDEIADAQDVFVGSEITDYGNTLSVNTEGHDEL